MSSRVHRGELPAQPIAWRQVGTQTVESSAPMDLQRAGAGAAGPSEARILELEKQAEQRAQAARQQGRQEGENAVRQQLAGQVDAAMNKLARAVEEISGLRQRFRHEAEDQVVQLALAVARRILHRELTLDPDAVAGIVKSALEKMDAREVQRVRTDPDTAPQLQRQLEGMGVPRRVEVVPDPALERGAVIFETTRGALDASVETQLAEIERGFVDLVRHSP